MGRESGWCLDGGSTFQAGNISVGRVDSGGDVGLVKAELRAVLRSGEEGVVPTQKHQLGVVGGNGDCLGSKVGKHRVRVPTSNELHCEGLGPSTEQGCGSSRPEAVGMELVR